MQEKEIKLYEIAEKYFPSDRYTVKVTGSSIIFFKGTQYLVFNLFTSLALAILLIALFMAWMFKSKRMVLVALLPNIIPQIITAAIMGYFGIPIKASTILVFSIAFGISVDGTISGQIPSGIAGNELEYPFLRSVGLERSGTKYDIQRYHPVLRLRHLRPFRFRGNRRTGNPSIDHLARRHAFQPDSPPVTLADAG